MHTISPHGVVQGSEKEESFLGKCRKVRKWIIGYKMSADCFITGHMKLFERSVKIIKIRAAVWGEVLFSLFLLIFYDDVHFVTIAEPMCLNEVLKC